MIRCLNETLAVAVAAAAAIQNCKIDAKHNEVREWERVNFLFLYGFAEQALNTPFAVCCILSINQMVNSN